MSDIPLSPPSGPPAMPSDRLWFDPAMLNVATYPQWDTITLAASVPLQLATPNPRRWGIGFSTSTIGTALSVSPWPEILDFVFGSNSVTGSIPFFTLFQFGPLVSNGWWGLAAGVTPVRVVELIRY